jgi:hypothetical protein
MELRNESATRVSPVAVLVAALVLLGSSTGWAQSLTTLATPSSGAAGVNSSTLTGSGFPAGAITGATVHFGANCSLPSAASTPVTQVTVAGTLRRFQFLIPASLAPGVYRVWVSGTAGATAFNTLNKPSCSSITVTASVQGTASLGAAIRGAAVTLMDADGTSRTGITASDGTFALNSAGLTPPFLVKVVTASAVGSFPAGTTLFSVSADENASTRINVHVLSDLMVRSFYSAQGLDAGDAFASPIGPNAAPNEAAVLSLANLVIPAVQLWLDQAGVVATADAPGDDAINLISSRFVAYPPGVNPPSGLDAVLHKITSETVNAGDGAVTRVIIAGGTITETITPVYANLLITLNTNTVDASTGGGSTASFSGLALTSALQPLANGINATLAAFANTVNTEGLALTANDLLPFYASDYLNAGNTAVEDANEEASELPGITFTRLELIGIKSVNGNVANVIIAVAFEAGGQSDSGAEELFFKEEGGVWLLYGDQRIADVSVDVQSRTAQGGASLGPGVFSGTFASAGASARHGVLTSVTVSGPTNNPAVRIWDNATSRPLFQGAQFIDNGQSFDQFFRLSQNLGNNLGAVVNQVPPGSPFTLNLTTSLGNRQYTVHSNDAYTTEVIQFTGLPAHVALPSVVGQTVNYTFTLPQTYPVSSVFLFTHIFDGPPNDPNTHSCSLGANGPLTLNFSPTYAGAGAITFPANMSACGLNPSVPIVFINVFLEVDGAGGQGNFVQLAYPY